MKMCLTFTCLFLFFSTIVFAQKNNWELKKNENGIRIYTQQVEDSNFKEFKAEMTVSSDISEVIDIVKNVAGYKNWMADIEKVELLKEDEDNIYYYAESSVPWPLDNRDMVYHIHFSNKNDTEAKIVITGISDYIPEKKGIVRIEKAIGYWKLVSLEENKIKVTYQLHAEPGGTIPAWLANSKVIDMPFETLGSFRNILKKVY